MIRKAVIRGFGQIKAEDTKHLLAVNPDNYFTSVIERNINNSTKKWAKLQEI